MVRDPLPDSPRTEAVQLLRRFVHGQVASDALGSLTRGLHLEGAGDLCDLLGLGTRDFLEIDLRVEHIAQLLRRYLHTPASQPALDSSRPLDPPARVTNDEFPRWTRQVLSMVHSLSYRTSRVSRRGLDRTLELIALLLEPSPLSRAGAARRCLEEILAALTRCEPPPLRRILATLWRSVDAVHLSAAGPPLEPGVLPGFSVPGEIESHWVDLSVDGVMSEFPPARLLPRAPAPVRLIPLSVFTRSFFYNALPRILRGGEGWYARYGSSWCYHPENDKVLELLDTFPELRGLERTFQYFVDAEGLAEIVVGATALGREELVGAARIFCLLNRIPAATLDGSPVPGLAGSGKTERGGAA